MTDTTKPIEESLADLVAAYRSAGKPDAEIIEALEEQQALIEDDADGEE